MKASSYRTVASSGQLASRLDRSIAMMKVKVYRFKTRDAVSGECLISLRLGTRSAIAKINGEILEATETEVYPTDIDSEGFTTIDFLA